MPNVNREHRKSITQRASVLVSSLKQKKGRFSMRLKNLIPKSFDLDKLMDYREAALTVDNPHNQDSIKRFEDGDDLSTFSVILDEL